MGYLNSAMMAALMRPEMGTVTNQAMKILRNRRQSTAFLERSQPTETTDPTYSKGQSKRLRRPNLHWSGNKDTICMEADILQEFSTLYKPTFQVRSLQLKIPDSPRYRPKPYFMDSLVNLSFQGAKYLWRAKWQLCSSQIQNLHLLNYSMINKFYSSPARLPYFWCATACPICLLLNTCM